MRTKSWTLHFTPKLIMGHYTIEQKIIAIRLLDRLQSPKKVITALGYPTNKNTLYRWTKARRKYILEDEEDSSIPFYQKRPRSVINHNDIFRCLMEGMSVKSTAETLGYSESVVYKWRQILHQQGHPIDMKRANHVKNSDKLAQEQLQEMRAQMQEMQLEIDILRETINVLKKDPGIDLTMLKNSEKAVIVDALRSKYSLPQLLKKVKLSRSSYYYIAKKAKFDKYGQLSIQIEKLFYKNKCCYGYRRIHHLLKREGIVVSEKIIRRIMKTSGLMVKAKKKRKYNSYQGEITPAVSNCLERDFHATKPNEKWLTDITEFSIPAGKVYLSPIIDCYDGLPVSWKIGESPNAELVNSMLDDAIALLTVDEKPIVHSDRGCHYRWPGWIERMNQAGLVRSMSRKGCSPDNSACEGFFGILKNEMFYERDWTNTSLEDFKVELEHYLVWFCKDRIKMSLGGLSPLDYRRSKGFAV